MRATIAAQWVSQVARKDPDQAIKWIYQDMSVFGEENIKSIAIQTAAKDYPELAAQYIERLGHGLQGYRAITGEKVLRVWAEQDSRAAAHWVIGLPEDEFPERNLWLIELSQNWFTKDPEGVMAYIEQGGNVPVQFVERVGKAYWKTDEDSARKWLNSLPDAYRTRVTKVIENF